MDSLRVTLAAQFALWSPAEIVAVLFAIFYLLLAIRENIWCWFCAGISTLIYIALYFDAKLYMESVLNVFYFVMAIYGWWVWRSPDPKDDPVPVVVWPLKVHALAATIVAGLVAVSGTLLSRYTDAAFPYIDSATTFAAMWATFLVARKVLENWYYWLLIDIVSACIYWSRGLELTTLLFILYVVMIPFGLFSWMRSLKKQGQFAGSTA